VLGSRCLQKHTDNNEPAVQHAYALTTYATQSKTFDSAFALLDPGISREDFLVAISRARGETTAYGVVADELLDPELGPGRREIDDEAQDLRAGGERVASEFAASEVSERMRLEDWEAGELAARREELEKRLPEDGKPAPAQEQLDRLDRRIDEGHSRLAQLADKREAIREAGSAEDGELALIGSAERLTLKQLDRLESEREPLAAEARAKSRQSTGLSAAERTELAMIEDRLFRLRRRDIAKERVCATEMIVEALGPRPSDATKAAIWNEGVDLIFAYRQRHRVSTTKGNPLGPKPREAARRHERRAAEVRLRRIQHALGRERQRVVERSPAISR
jgi:hypothetical protein